MKQIYTELADSYYFEIDKLTRQLLFAETMSRDEYMDNTSRLGQTKRMARLTASTLMKLDPEFSPVEFYRRCDVKEY